MHNHSNNQIKNQHHKKQKKKKTCIYRKTKITQVLQKLKKNQLKIVIFLFFLIFKSI